MHRCPICEQDHRDRNAEVKGGLFPTEPAACFPADFNRQKDGAENEDYGVLQDGIEDHRRRKGIENPAERTADGKIEIVFRQVRRGRTCPGDLTMTDHAIDEEIDKMEDKNGPFRETD